MVPKGSISARTRRASPVLHKQSTFVVLNPLTSGSYILLEEEEEEEEEEAEQ